MTTVLGDTGLWFVPTGEILPARKWSVGAGDINIDYEQGFTDVSNWPVTFGIGVRDRVEVFGAWSVVNRIDRDVRPLFFPTVSSPSTIDAGGVVNEYPFVSRGWSGNQLGDFWVGAKMRLTSEDAPVAIAVRGLLKIPTASDTNGAGTGKPDFAFDGIVSKEINRRVELSGFAGFIVRRDPDAIDLTNGFRWGFGAGLPTRQSLRLTAELHGEKYTSDVVTVTASSRVLTSLIAAPSKQKSPVNASLGLTWRMPKGVFAGAGINWNLNMKPRSNFGSFGDRTGDAAGFLIRVGYHPGVRIYVPPPPLAAPSPATMSHRRW